MDYILLSILGLYFLKGFIKGFVSTLLSLISVFAVAVCSWKLVEICLPYVYDMLQQPISNFISSILDNSIEGSFQNMAGFENAILSSNFAMFALIKNILPDLSFEGNLTAGQILAPSLSIFVCKALTFLVLFLFLNLVIKLFRILINKIIKVCGLSFGNRFLGGVLGFFKGVLVFAVIYFLLNVVSGVVLNEAFNNFIQGGILSNGLYDWIMNFIL